MREVLGKSVLLGTSALSNLIIARRKQALVCVWLPTISSGIQIILGGLRYCLCSTERVRRTSKCNIRRETKSYHNWRPLKAEEISKKHRLGSIVLSCIYLFWHSNVFYIWMNINIYYMDLSGRALKVQMPPSPDDNLRTPSNAKFPCHKASAARQQFSLRCLELTRYLYKSIVAMILSPRMCRMM